jgi:phospholipid/cholesterol/gamma-HCH transport system substrate-binding protein
MRQNTLEIIIGFAVIFIAFYFLITSYSGHNKDNNQQYQLKAKFDNVEGIIKGSDIQIAGIIIGNVHSLKLDNKTYSADVVLSINKDVKIPLDSRASVTSSGFLGGKFISISPGGDDDFLKPGEKIKYTQSSVNLESLIGKFIYSGGGGASANKASSTEASVPAAKSTQADPLPASLMTSQGAQAQ